VRTDPPAQRATGIAHLPVRGQPTIFSGDRVQVLPAIAQSRLIVNLPPPRAPEGSWMLRRSLQQSDTISRVTQGDKQVSEREEILTARLLTVLAHHLGQEPDEGSYHASLLPRSPVMLAAWANATSSYNNRRQVGSRHRSAVASPTGQVT
jgi:hypothetical protein